MGTNIPEPSTYCSKNDQKAIELRHAGNARFQERKYFEALDSYSASLAWAQRKEVAAFAFSNRSAILARIGLYRECLIEPLGVVPFSIAMDRLLWLDIEDTGFLFQEIKDGFKTCKTNLERIDFFIKMGTTVPEPSYHCTKDDQKAIQMREKGNAHYQKKKYLDALDSYTASLAWAQSKEVAAFAFSNRSAVLVRIDQYQECLIDIERAFKNGYPEASSAKLIKRRSEVLKLQEQLQSQSTHTNETIEETPDCIEIQTNEKYGRHVVAKRDIEIGELLLIEQPIASVLTRREDFFIYCHHCNLLCYNLIPCDSCSKMLFCGEECKERAWETYHKYVCGVQTLESMIYVFTIPLQVTITIMKELKDSSKSETLQDVKELCTHTDKRPLKELFVTSLSCYRIFLSLKNTSSFFIDFENMDDTFKEVLFLLHELAPFNGPLIGRTEPHDEMGLDVLSYAAGLYVTYSAFNHSCFPNAFFYYEGKTLFIRAIGTIKKGEQCFISYRYMYSDCSKVQRQKHSQEVFYFTCDCRACVEDWPRGPLYLGLFEYIPNVMAAFLQDDQKSKKRLIRTFIKKVKLLEPKAPSNKLMGLRQLIMMLYHSFENPRKKPYHG